MVTEGKEEAELKIKKPPRTDGAIHWRFRSDPSKALLAFRSMELGGGDSVVLPSKEWWDRCKFSILSTLEEEWDKNMPCS